MNDTPELKISVGESVEHFINNNQHFSFTMDRQPAGLNFHSYRWPVPSRGSVAVSAGDKSFIIPHVLSIMVVDDPERATSGLTRFLINAGLTAEPEVSHERARRLFMSFLDGLSNKGWKPVITYEDPRLAGEEAFQYYEEDNNYTVPPTYAPSLEQWMSLDEPIWHLHSDDIFVQIQLYRDRKKMRVDEPGSYFIAFIVESGEELAKDYVEPTERHRWKELWVDKIKELKRMRYEKERELAERGFTIFTEYEEPLIHPEDPVEP